MFSRQLLVLCVMVGGAISLQLEEGNLSQVKAQFDPLLHTSPLPTKNCTANYSCLNCTAVSVCVQTADGQSLGEIRQFNCPAGSWCEPLSGTCVAEQPRHCLIPAEFECLRDGYYPNLSDCSSYHYCVGGKAYLFRCAAPNRNYNPSTELCVPANYCANKNVCDKKNGIKVKLLSNDKQLFVYCLNGAVTTIDRCIGGYAFNEKKQVCEMTTCPRAGLFPSAENCTRYFQCDPTFKTSTTYNMTELTCPPGEGFLESAYQCVNRTLVPNCRTELSALFS